MPRDFDDVQECVEQTLRQVGRQVVLALPLGIGKPNPLANEFYRRAQRDPALSLKVFTALSLHAPLWHSELERRFLEPLNRRLFGGSVPLDYVRDLHAGSTPDNVQIVEFFLEPGGLLNVAHSQQHYVSTNYTHVARDVAAQGVNVIGQLVAKRTVNGEAQYSLGSNPDLTLDLLQMLGPERRGRVVLIGEVNRQMPFMFGDAAVAVNTFDALLESPRYEFDLFAPPNQALHTVDYAIGLYCAALVRDAGTLQVGIGELGDAVVYGLLLRHQNNDEFRGMLAALAGETRFGALIDSLGGRAPFESGLYGCTEMFIAGFLDLYRGGILKRRVYDDARLQKLLNAGRISERIDDSMLAALADSGTGNPLSAAEFATLQRLGVFRRDCRLVAGVIQNGDGVSIAADLGSAVTRRELLAHCTARQLSGGVLLHGGFFLGPRGFYAALRDMAEPERSQFCMSGVSFVNQLDGADRELRVAQRCHGRFINTTMMVTLLGAAVSDGLADGRVVSGVGGQYNFVAMAHALPDARSLLCLRSTRSKNGVLTSNLVWSYAHSTIPRHLRDVVVTEYGIADLRGKTDAEVIAALINVADSRFQDSLLRSAVEAGKLPRGYRVPDMHRANLPGALQERFALPRARGLFSEFPFGTDLTAEEITLGKALSRLKQRLSSRREMFKALTSVAFRRQVPGPVKPLLERMSLDAPRSLQERLWQRLLIRELGDIS